MRLLDTLFCTISQIPKQDATLTGEQIKDGQSHYHKWSEMNVFMNKLLSDKIIQVSKCQEHLDTLTALQKHFGYHGQEFFNKTC